MTVRSRIYLIITAIVIITIVGALVMIGYTYRMEGLLTQNIDKYIGGLQAAQSLETALVKQKGFASYYFIDGNSNWLLQMDQYHHIFKDKLDKIRRFSTLPEEKRVLSLIESEYAKYLTTKNQVVDYLRSGNLY